MAINNLFNEIKSVLKKDPQNRFYTENGELITEKVFAASVELDENLITLLLNNETIKNFFFKKVGGSLIFDKVKFGWAINNKEFLENSYTRFKNKIGLTNSNNEYINYKNDVVLSFPFKDCVLEGGQDKEEAKRKEIFYNETLSPDSIDTLLSPKALVNSIKFSSIRGGGKKKIKFKI